MLTPEDKQFYHNRLNLFEQDGWRELVQELKTLEDLTNQLDSVESEKDLWFARGQLSILRQMTGLEETTRQAAEELEL